MRLIYILVLTLMIISNVFGLAVEEVVNNIKAVNSKIDTIQADLEEIGTFNEKIFKDKGKVAIMKPNKMRIEYSTKKIIFVNNGEIAWYYNLEKKIILPSKAVKGVSFPDYSYFMDVFLKGSKIVGEEKFEGKDTVVLELAPDADLNIKPPANLRKRIWIDKQNWLLLKYSNVHEFYLSDKKNVMENTKIYRNIKINAEIDEAVFVFKVPEGVKDYGPINAKRAEVSGTLASMRSAITIYYCDTEGNWPESLDDLVPKYIKEIPKEPITGSRYVVNEYDGKGGWYYVTDKNDRNCGQLFMNLSEKDERGVPYSNY